MSGVLGIDTASDTMAVAIVEGDRVRIEARQQPQAHSQLLLGLIDEICAGDRGRIGRIVVTRGPGGYAGVRVGVATAQGLAMSLGVPLTGVDTFAAIVEAARGQGAVFPLVAVHPAGRGEFAMTRFDNGGRDDTVIGSLADAPDGTLCGEGMGERGGIDVTAAERCRAAIALDARGLAQDPEALYVREPHITLARKNPVSGVADAPPGRTRGGTS
ncbi:MAG: tRNA (adenosine(37)-N6)-threonylcarbamoyltransferase complex dimerization subunit type 1 TsaB [Dehalococcoidia bacterium]|nr:tRNA (adenosine(37)-N6)-threonylcarbamoyltransferase complex dimerization subunit type 1 TsaB [Dehalococcoidia bacterium]